MDCAIRNQLRERYRRATIVWVKYDESLEGVAKTLEHMNQLERLENETRITLSELTQHEEDHRCQQRD